jgi:hypothetical protein
MKSNLDFTWRTMPIPSPISWSKPPGFSLVVRARVFSLLGAFDEAFLMHMANRYSDPIRACALAELQRRKEMDA